MTKQIKNHSLYKYMAKKGYSDKQILVVWNKLFNADKSIGLETQWKIIPIKGQ